MSPDRAALEHDVQVAARRRTRALERFHDLGDELAPVMRAAAASATGFNAIARTTRMSTRTVAEILRDTTTAAHLDAPERELARLARRRENARRAYTDASAALAAVLAAAHAERVPITRLQQLADTSRQTIYDMLAGRYHPDPAQAGRPRPRCAP